MSALVAAVAVAETLSGRVGSHRVLECDEVVQTPIFFKKKATLVNVPGARSLPLAGVGSDGRNLWPSRGKPKVEYQQEPVWEINWRFRNTELKSHNLQFSGNILPLASLLLQHRSRPPLSRTDLGKDTVFTNNHTFPKKKSVSLPFACTTSAPSS